jgi:drug/metabolite transporter (DMT)-like permease
MIDSRFWISLLVITVIGTVGSILFKYGTDTFGTLTFERLLQMRLSETSLLALAMLSTGILMVLLGGYALKDSLFAFEFLFHPAVFIALAMLFVSRFLIGIPLSVTGLGRLNALLTVLSIVSTAVASAIVFKETFTLRMIAGFLLGAISILLIGQA